MGVVMGLESSETEQGVAIYSVADRRGAGRGLRQLNNDGTKHNNNMDRRSKFSKCFITLKIALRQSPS